jgi:hypothetical protein
MIGTIRKHSKWLWIVIAGLTIISFVFFMSISPVQKGGGAQTGGLGIIYGREITTAEFARAQGEFYLSHWMRNSRWPDKDGMTHEDISKETYVRVLLNRKAAQLGINVGEAEAATAASELLRSMGRNGQAAPMKQFVEQILTPERLTAADFLDFLRSELAIQQLIQSLGISGALVTPQEAGQLYDRENQEVSAQAVFFAASNYLSQVTIEPAAVAQFYTNNMAFYREPERVQVNYVFFNVTNYLEQSKAEWEKTNFTEVVEAAYQQYGQSQFPDAKTPDEAKGKIRELLIRDRALRSARQAANDFATALFAIAPAKPENLVTLAKEKGLKIATTLPFAANSGPMEIEVPSTFTKAAFALNADEPYGGPLPAQDGVYLFSLAKHLPSAIPALDQIRLRVSSDYHQQQAYILAYQAGTNFYHALTNQMAKGGSFAAAAAAAGFAPTKLSPFSLSSSDIPEAGEHATVGQLKQAAFTTPVGKVSGFSPDNDGGFVLFVSEMLPVDQTKKTASLPQFENQVRRSRQSEAFNLWLMAEANRELKNTPVYSELTKAKNGQQ